MTNKHYFPGLNALRLYAALCVVIGHTSTYFPIHYEVNFFVGRLILYGYDAVTLFFVISGFLITYLLLDEQQRNGEVNVKAFYIRRALRIWPLYFLIILLTYLLAPGSAPLNGPILVSLLLFSPQIANAFIPLGFLGHLWSIGVEEWFYFIWPVIMRHRLLTVIAAIILMRLVLAFLISPHFALYGDRYVNPWLIIFHALRFECMAIGALGAWIYYHRHWTLKWFYRFQWLIYMLLVPLIMLKFDAGILYDLVVSLIFLGLILNVSTNPRSVLKLENRWLSAGGKMTYGIYIYHLLIVYIISRVWTAQGYLADIAAFVLVIVVTLLVAAASYRWIETPILKFKPYSKSKAADTLSAVPPSPVL